MILTAGMMVFTLTAAVRISSQVLPIGEVQKPTITLVTNADIQNIFLQL